jgi:hypothetical protein
LKLLRRAIRSFLWRTGIGVYIASRFWRVVSEGTDVFYLYQNKKRVFDEIPVDFNDVVYSRFIKCDSHKWSLLQEYVLGVSNALIEPERCMIILKGRRLLDQSRDFKFEEPYPFILDYLYPSKLRKHIESAVIYDGNASRNYYHHLVNAVNSLYLLDQSGVLPVDIPLLVNRRIFNSPFFKYLYQNSDKFRKYNWVI